MTSSFFENWVDRPVLFSKTGYSDQFFFRELGRVPVLFRKNQFFYPFLFLRTGPVLEKKNWYSTQFFSKELVTSSSSFQKNWLPVPVLFKRTGHQFQFFSKELVTSSRSFERNWTMKTSSVL